MKYDLMQTRNSRCALRFVLFTIGEGNIKYGNRD